MTHYHQLSRLNPAISWWFVCVKVLRIFTEYIFYHPKEALGLILRDEQGDQIEALIHPDYVDHDRSVIEEDDWFTIMEFKIEPNNGPKRVTKDPYKIYFNSRTFVLPDDPISQCVYPLFTSFPHVLRGQVDRTYLLELVGYVVKAGKLTNEAEEPYHRSGYRFPFVLKDTEGHMLDCLACGDTAVEFNNGYNNALSTSGPVVVCVLRWWRVTYGMRKPRIYCDWPISKVLFNPDNPDLKDTCKLIVDAVAGCDLQSMN